MVAPQYRGVDGGEGADELGGADVQDVLAIVDVARRQPGAAPGGIFLLGGSREAMEGAIAMRAGLDVRAAVFRGGLYDARAVLADRPAMQAAYAETMRNFADTPKAALDRRRPVLWANELHAPILLLHGQQDWRVKPDIAHAFGDA